MRFVGTVVIFEMQPDRSNDDYEDECVAETWRDGGVLSEADA